MLYHQRHPSPQKSTALPAAGWSLVLVAALLSSGCYPAGTGDSVGKVLPAVAVTIADGVVVEPVIQVGHRVPVRTFQFSPDGKWLLTSGIDAQVIQWDAETGDLVRSFGTPAPEHFEIAPDGQSLLLMLRQDPLTSHGSSIEPGEATAIPSLISLDSGRVLQQVRELPDDAYVRMATLTTDARYMLLRGAYQGLSPIRRWLWDVQEQQFVGLPAEPVPSAASDDPLPVPPEERQRPFHFERTIRPDGQILVTHSPISFSHTPDGLRVIVRDYPDTGSAWDVTQLWDIASGELLATLAERDGEPRPFQFSPDGARFLRGIGSKQAEIRETATGEVVLQLEAHPETITALAYSPDGATVVSGAEDGALRLWHAASGQLLRDGPQVNGSVRSVAYGPDAQRLLVATGGNGALLFDLQSGKLIRRIGEPRKASSWERQAHAAFSPDGRRILIQSQGVNWNNFKASLWDTETGNLLQDLCAIRSDRGRRDLNPITLSPDGRWGISADGGLISPGSQLLLWDIQSGRIVHRFDKHLAGRAAAFWDHKPDWPLTSSGDLLQGRLVGPSQSSDFRIAFPREVHEVLPSIQGLPPETKRWLESFIVTTSRRWPLCDDAEAFATTVEVFIATPSGHWPPVLTQKTGGVISPCGRRVAMWTHGGPRMRALTIYDVEQGAKVELTPVIWPVALPPHHLVFSPDGRYVVLGDFHRKVIVVDAQTGEKWFETDGRPVFGPDGKRAVFLGSSHTLWDIESATMLQDFGRHSPVRRLVFSPGGRSLWMSASSGTGLYSAVTGELLHETGEPLRSRSASPTFGLAGARVATQPFGNPRQPGALWDFENARKLTDLVDTDGRPITLATFTPDGRRLVAEVLQEVSTADSSAAPRAREQHPGLIVWDAETGTMLSREVASEPAGPPARVMFTPDGDHCLTVHAHAAILWEMVSGRPLHVFRENGSTPLAVAISPDGRSLLTVVRGCRATLWDMTTGERVRAFGEIPIIANGRSPSVWTALSEFSPDGQRIICRSHSGHGVHQVCVKTGQLICGFYLLGNGDQAVAYTPDGTLASTSPERLRYRQPGTNELLPRNDAER